VITLNVSSKPENIEAGQPPLLYVLRDHRPERREMRLRAGSVQRVR
jgi:hypothetical protein